MFHIHILIYNKKNFFFTKLYHLKQELNHRDIQDNLMLKAVEFNYLILLQIHYPIKKIFRINRLNIKFAFLFSTDVSQNGPLSVK